MQARIQAGKFKGKQAAGQQPGAQRAVTLEQADVAPQTPQPQQKGRPHKTDCGLKHWRHFGDGGLDQHLLKTPEQAAAQQQADSDAVKMVLA